MKRFDNMRRGELDAYDEDGAVRHVLHVTLDVANAMCSGEFGAFSRAVGITDELLSIPCNRLTAYATGVLFARAHGLAQVERRLTAEAITFNLWESEPLAAFEQLIAELELGEIVHGRAVCTAMTETGFVVPSDALHEVAWIYEEPGYIERIDANRVLIAHYAPIHLGRAPIGDYELVAMDLCTAAGRIERRVGDVLDVNERANFHDVVQLVDV